MNNPTPPQCLRCRQLLADSLDRSLSAEEMHELQAHLDTCEECHELESVLALSAELARESPSPASLRAERLEHVVQSVMQRLEEKELETEEPDVRAGLRGGEPTPSKRFLHLIWSRPSLVGAVALVIIMLLFVSNPQTPPPAPPTPTKKALPQSAPEVPAGRADKVQVEEAQRPAVSGAESDTPPKRERDSARAFGGREGALQVSPEAKSVATSRTPAAVFRKLGAETPRSAAERDSLRRAWTHRLQESRDPQEKAALREALKALDELPPQQN
jgi:hypothetical protein